MKLGAILSAGILYILIAGCSPPGQTSATKTRHTGKLKFINEYVIPNAIQFKGTTVGGLSGIEYDPGNGLYYLLSDDRSDRNPARFYAARVYIGKQGIDSVQLVDVITLMDKNGNPYPNRRTDSLRTPDPESIRLNRQTNELAWSSEGDRTIGSAPVLVDPAIYITDKAGRHKTELEIPPNLRMQLQNKGPRLNGVFEGISFSEDFKFLYASLEEPLYDDGNRAGSGDSTAWVRFVKFDLSSKKAIAQYAYQIDPVRYVEQPAGSFRINGISESYCIGKEQFLVVERSFSTGHKGNAVRIYLADAHDAQDISSVESLGVTPPSKPMSKRLLLDMGNLGRYIDNVEGISFGPLLANGYRSVILVTDDNFEGSQKTQFILLAYQP